MSAPLFVTGMTQYGARATTGADAHNSLSLSILHSCARLSTIKYIFLNIAPNKKELALNSYTYDALGCVTQKYARNQ